MLADTATIGDFGAAQARHAADLAALGRRLTRVSALLTSDGLGPVGARFLAAMCDAVHRDVREAGALGEGAAARAVTARRTAAAYSTVEVASGQHVSTVAG